MNTSNTKVGNFQIGKVYEDIKRIYVLCSWQDYQKTWQYLGGGKFRDCACNSLAEPDIDNLTNSDMTPEEFCKLSGSIADDIVKFQSSLQYTGN